MYGSGRVAKSYLPNLRLYSQASCAIANLLHHHHPHSNHQLPMLRHPPIPAEREIRHRRQQISREHIANHFLRRALIRYRRVVNPRYRNIARDLEAEELRPGIVVCEEDRREEALACDGRGEVRPCGGDVLGAVIAGQVDVDGCVELLEGCNVKEKR